MKKTLKATAAAALLAVAIFAAPAAATAYTPSISGGSSTFSVQPGGSVSVSFTGFAPSESVTFTLTGENAAGATLAFVKFAVTSTTTTKTADAEGTAAVTVTLPADASGEYTLTAVGAESGEADPVTITVGDLAATGSDSSALLGLWVGGGALVLAGASIAVATTVRRQRQQTSA